MFSFQLVEFMCDVPSLTQLAAPPSVGKLASGMHHPTVQTNKKGDLFKAMLQTQILATRIAESAISESEGFHSFILCHTVWPVWAARPPPEMIFASGPRNTIVSFTGRAGHLKCREQRKPCSDNCPRLLRGHSREPGPTPANPPPARQCLRRSPAPLP